SRWHPWCGRGPPSSIASRPDNGSAPMPATATPMSISRLSPPSFGGCSVMPKRRSLVGTGREAMGDAPAAQPEAASAPVTPTNRAKRPRATPKAPEEPARDAMPAYVPAAAAPERDRAAMPSPASPYATIMGLASATLRQNLETGARLARCKSPMEVLAAQTAHAAALTQTFFAASLKLMQLGWSGAQWTAPWP